MTNIAPAMNIARATCILAGLLYSGFSTPAHAQSINIAIGTEPTTLDPQLSQDGGARMVNDNIYETLIWRNADGAFTPGLAASMPVRLNPTTWQIKLRQGVKFQDGEPFDADAVVFSIKRILDPNYHSQQLAYFGTLLSAEKMDDYTVNVTTRGPDSVFVARMFWMKMVPPKAAAAPDFAQHPAGTGPFRFAAWNKGQNIVLEANPDYWGPKPQVQRANYRFIAESGTRLSGLLTKEFDLITNLAPEDVKRAPKVASVSGIEHPVIVLNATSGATKDLRVRQALNYAIDKNALAKNLFLGYARVDQGQFLSPSWFGFNPDLEPYSYDPAKAKQLLSEAGASGATIELISTQGRWLKDREMTEAVADYWRAVGLKVDARILDFQTYLRWLFGKDKAPALYVSHINELGHADRTLADYYLKSGRGAANDDDELANLIAAARNETDTTKQAALYQQAVKRARDQAYFAFLIGVDQLYGLSQRLDWQPGVDGALLIKNMKVSGG